MQTPGAFLHVTSHTTATCYPPGPVVPDRDITKELNRPEVVQAWRRAALMQASRFRYGLDILKDVDDGISATCVRESGSIASSDVIVAFSPRDIL